MARVLIAGASGLTGMALVRHLADEHEIVAMARRTAPAGLPTSVTWISADIGSPGWTSALPSAFDAVYALFQSPDFRDFPAKAADVFRTNVGGLQELLDHAKTAGATRFVFTSTGGLYAPSDAPLTEDMPLTTGGPLGYYLTTKRCGELLVEAYASQFATLIVRPFFIYGPGQSAGMLMPRLIDSVRSGKPLGLQGNNGLSINPVHADDAARLLAAALKPEANGIVNLAGPETVSLRVIGETIGRLTGREALFDVNTAVAAPVVVADLAHMKTMLGTPLIRIADGLASMIGSD